METVALGEEKIIGSHQKIVDYALLSECFAYPHTDLYRERVKAAYAYLSSFLPEAAKAMDLFVECVDKSTLTEIQELFLRSFDVQALTTLDIGFILFGEDYKRGQLLVHLNREHREAGNACETELSDHLPNVLRLLPKMKDEQLRNELALKIVIPAIEKMIGEFEGKKVEKKDEVYKKHQKTVIEYSAVYRTAFQTLLQALFITLKNDFGYIPIAELLQKSTNKPGIPEEGQACGSCSDDKTPNDFGGNVENELNIEQ